MSCKSLHRPRRGVWSTILVLVTAKHRRLIQTISLLSWFSVPGQTEPVRVAPKQIQSGFTEIEPGNDLDSIGPGFFDHFFQEIPVLHMMTFHLMRNLGLVERVYPPSAENNGLRMERFTIGYKTLDVKVVGFHLPHVGMVYPQRPILPPCRGAGFRAKYAAKKKGTIKYQEPWQKAILRIMLHNHLYFAGTEQQNCIFSLPVIYAQVLSLVLRCTLVFGPS